MGGLIPVAPDEVATIVTTLEMRARPPLRPMPESRLRLVAWDKPDPDKYRALFRRVGEPWLWFSRLAMDNGTLTRIIHDDGVSIFAAIDPAGVEIGMLELDFRSPGACELSYFGLVPELAGRSHGRWLMAQALQHAWIKGIDRVWLHTCTLDHPSALNFYRAQGFTAILRTIETFPDPRATGLLPPDASSQIPYLSRR